MKRSLSLMVRPAVWFRVEVAIDALEVAETRLAALGVVPGPID